MLNDMLKHSQYIGSPEADLIGEQKCFLKKNLPDFPNVLTMAKPKLFSLSSVNKVLTESELN